jgi:hypothetical protein
MYIYTIKGEKMSRVPDQKLKVEDKKIKLINQKVVKGK